MTSTWLVSYTVTPQCAHAHHDDGVRLLGPSIAIANVNTDDSGRRTSSRATKGQHTKQDLLDSTPQPKKKGKKGSKKVAAQEDEEEVIRCICGATETTDSDEEPWIACDKCGVWQHNICMGMPTYDEDIPDNYLCEQCGPGNHKELLSTMKRGEKLWEFRRAEYEKQQAKEQAEEDAKRKGKKKGKRQSDVTSSQSNGQAKSPSTPIEPKETPAKTGSTKRKAEGSSESASAKVKPFLRFKILANQLQAPTKVRKVSEAHVTPQQPSTTHTLPAKISDLEKTRQGIAKAMEKSLNATVQTAIDTGIVKTAVGDTVQSKSERLAILVEDALFAAHPNKELYNKQARALGFNLKSNQELCNGLLTGTLLPQELAVMSTEDMATSKLKQERAKMQEIADKQATMVTDGGPVIRRTHKGDELVEGGNDIVPDEIPTLNAARRRSMADPNVDMATRSRENSIGSGEDVELPDIPTLGNAESQKSLSASRQTPVIQTKQPPIPERKASTQSDFDLKKVLDKVSVHSPVNQQVPTQLRRPSSNAPPLDGPGVDPDIDKMLQDDDEPPYSPKFDSDPEVVWHGKVTMDAVASFSATAKHIGGLDLGSPMAYEELLSRELRVAGRIEEEKANVYLCSLRYSPPTDIVIIALSPQGESSVQGCRELYEYFQTRNRFGVFSNKNSANIRDTYLVPAPPSPASYPDFIDNLEGHKIPQNRTEPLLLVTLVIRPPRSYESSGDVQSPSIINQPQHQMSMGGTGPSMSPIATQGQQFPQATPTQAPQYPVDEEPLTDEQRFAKQREGEAIARDVLGPYITAPTVSFLLPQAFQMRKMEWEVVRDILANDPKAQQDLTYLSTQISQRQPPESAAPA